jgi:hypothetical protein
MPQLFGPASNALFRVVLILSLLLPCGGGVLLAFGFAYSDWHTRKGLDREQPIPFSHEHHVNELGIDCRYCHTGVTESAYAGLPATKVCMTCHTQIWWNSPTLEPVRSSWANNTPIQWNRVHDLPDYVYFDHSVHVAKGVGCTTCHGQINEMPLTHMVVNLQMRWCLDCHRNPEKNLRPRDQVFSVHYFPPPDQLALGAKLVEQYHVQKDQLTNCSLCHR